MTTKEIIKLAKIRAAKNETITVIEFLNCLNRTKDLLHHYGVYTLPDDLNIYERLTARNKGGLSNKMMELDTKPDGDTMDKLITSFIIEDLEEFEK